MPERPAVPPSPDQNPSNSLFGSNILKRRIALTSLTLGTSSFTAASIFAFSQGQVVAGILTSLSSGLGIFSLGTEVYLRATDRSRRRSP